MSPWGGCVRRQPGLGDEVDLDATAVVLLPLFHQLLRPRPPASTCPAPRRAARRRCPRRARAARRPARAASRPSRPRPRSSPCTVSVAMPALPPAPAIGWYPRRRLLLRPRKAGRDGGDVRVERATIGVVAHTRESSDAAARARLRLRRRLMALEILGARVLAPVLGNSIFVWGALISSFMVAMSVGYWVGGLLSTRHAHLRALGLAAAGAGALTVRRPAASPARCCRGPRRSGRASGRSPRRCWCSSRRRCCCRSSRRSRCASPRCIPTSSGGPPGSLYALSTAGSILGSLGTAFWLIPLAPVDTLVVGTGVLLARHRARRRVRARRRAEATAGRVPVADAPSRRRARVRARAWV